MSEIAKIVLYILKIIYKIINKSDKLNNEEDPRGSYTLKGINIFTSKNKIIMPKQSSFKSEAINKWGCYFLCLVFLSRLVKVCKNNRTGQLGINDIELMFKGINSSNINKLNAFVKNPNGVLKELGVLDTIEFKDTFISEESLPMYYNNNNLFVAKYVYKDYNHFCVVDKDKRLLYDSLGQSLVRTKGVIGNLRPFEIKDDTINFEIIKLRQTEDFYECINTP